MAKAILKSSLLAAVISLSLVVSAQAFTTYGPVKHGETLWGIAKKTRPNKHVSVDLMMSAIEKLNPQSFDDLNKGILHVGAKLEVPSTVTELRDVLHGKLPANTASDTATTPATPATSAAVTSSASTSVAPAASAGTAAPANATTAPAPTTNSNTVTATTPLPTGRNKVAALQNMVVQLQQQLQAAETQLSTAAQTQQQLQAAQQKITELQQASQSSGGGFPWAWLWFVILALGAGYWVWNKRREQSEGAEVHIEPSAGSLSNAAELDFVEDSLPEDADGSILADAMIAMAEGDYKSAKRILLNGIRKEHDNIELRMRLLEVYVQLNDRDAFNAESDYMLKNLITETDDTWKTVRAMYLKKWVYDA